MEFGDHPVNLLCNVTRMPIESWEFCQLSGQSASNSQVFLCMIHLNPTNSYGIWDHPVNISTEMCPEYQKFPGFLCMIHGRENFVLGPLAPRPSLLFSSPLFSVVGWGFFLFFLALCALGGVVEGRCWPCTLPPLSPLSSPSSSPQADHHLLVFCLSFLHRATSP